MERLSGGEIESSEWKCGRAAYTAAGRSAKRAFAAAAGNEADDWAAMARQAKSAAGMAKTSEPGVRKRGSGISFSGKRPGSLDARGDACRSEKKGFCL